MDPPDVLFLLVQGVYGAFTLAMWVAWRRIPLSAELGLDDVHTFFSVIVAVRNEEDNILHLLEDLSGQVYPQSAFEVIVVNDHSTDDTARLVADTVTTVNFQLRLLHLSDYLQAPSPGDNYKKKAIEYGVSAAHGQWIVLTDGDCRVGSRWLTTIAGCVSTTNDVQMVSGAVTFGVERSVFGHMQTVEFASLIGSGAATLQLGLPTMCNAANLAFAKSAFVEVDGYAGTADTATGDDLFLMHKLHTRYPGGISFLRNPAGIVFSRAKDSWQAFYQQRKRWASKWNLYQDWRVSTLAVFVFLANAAIPVGLAGSFLGRVALSWLLIGVAARFAAEFMFLRDVLRFLGKEGQAKWIFPVQLIYSFYVTFFAIIAQKRGYVWKGRKLY
jgi:cellulose synthase/poly-beta-1,6-N-acetylglucosamine synthase-like glycosyltransferase